MWRGKRHIIFSAKNIFRENDFPEPTKIILRRSKQSLKKMNVHCLHRGKKERETMVRNLKRNSKYLARGPEIQPQLANLSLNGGNMGLRTKASLSQLLILCYYAKDVPKVRVIASGIFFFWRRRHSNLLYSDNLRDTIRNFSQSCSI